LNHFDLQIALLCLAIEARDHTKKEIEISPHICLTGSAGKGKTLLGKMLYPTSIASLMTNDSQGVGQLQLGPKRKMFKMDDLPAAILRDHKIAASIKSMYHNDWSAKIHGSKENNKAAAVFITTNEADPLLKLSDISDLKAIERRFIIGSVSELEKAPKIERLYSVNRTTSDDIIIEILRRINSKLHTHDCHKDLQVAKEYVSAFAQAILLEEQRTEGSPDEGSSHIEGGSVPHRGATSGTTSDSAGPPLPTTELHIRDSTPPQPIGSGSSRPTSKRKRRAEKVKSRATDILPKKKIKLSIKKAPRKQRTPIEYEDITDDDLDPNHRPDGGVLPSTDQPVGETPTLLSALSVRNEHPVRSPSPRMDDRPRDEMATVLSDGNLPIEPIDILAEAISTTIGEPSGTTDDELLAFAAEIELGGTIL